MTAMVALKAKPRVVEQKGGGGVIGDDGAKQ